MQEQYLRTACGAGPRPLLTPASGWLLPTVRNLDGSCGLEKILCQKDQRHIFHVRLLFSSCPAPSILSYAQHLSGSQAIKKTQIRHQGLLPSLPTSQVHSLR